jgi:restriction endonuclease S subunit
MRDGWIETSLEEIAEVVGGGTPSTAISEYWDGNIVWLTPTEITSQDGKIVSDSIRKITDLGFKNSGAQMLKKDSVILTSRASVGYVALSGKDLCTNQGFQSLVPKQSVLAKFLMFWIQQNRSEFESRSAGSTFKEISKSNVKSIKLQLPPLPEQKRIIDLISSVDSYAEALQQQLESAKRSRNAVLHELLTAGGDDWEYKTLSDICEVRDGTHDSPKPSHEGFALVTSKNIKDGKLDLESAYLISPQDYIEVNKRSKVEQFNLLISMIGTIGEVIVIEDKPNFAIKNVGLLKSTEPILSRYLCHYLGSQLGKNAISLSVSGSTQKFISLGKLRGLPVLYPPRENQKAIVEAMSLFDQQISKNLEVAARIKNLRSSMLSDLLSGEHQIPDSYDKVIGAA